MPRIDSIQVGQARTYDDPDAPAEESRTWTTAFFKEPVNRAVRIAAQGVEGDQQADRRFHGGTDKAVLVYSADHFPEWLEVAGIQPAGGGFGENLTVSSLSEEDVCIGDQWSAADLLFQVSQPRQPCFKLGRRWNMPRLVKLVAFSGWTGWYLRVLREGVLEAGAEFTLLERPHPEWTVARANLALFRKEFPVAEAAQLAELPELAESWREDLLGRLGGR